MSMVYKEGKVTVTQGSTKLVGIGTKFLNPIFNIFTGQIIQIRTGDRVLINTIDEVVSDTEIKLAFDSPESTTEADYVILMTTVDSISDAANKIVAMTKHSVVLAELMVDWFTLTGEIEMTLPDGSKITVMSITEIQNQLSQKATKDNIKGFYKLYKSKKEADDDLVNRVDGDQVLIWSDDKSTYGFYKVVDGSYELVESERKVSTINNVKPDDTGNVQITLPGGNPSLWLGEVTWFPYDQGGVGYSGLLPADGQLHKRADYPDTWAAIEGGLIASVSEDKWQAGENLVFSTGDGSSTFRVPNLMQGQALSAAKKGDKGSKVLEQVPYIKMINGKSPDENGNIIVDIPKIEIESKVSSYNGDNVNWKGSHYMTGTVGSKSGNDERIALDTSNGKTQIVVNGGGGGWRYFGLPVTSGTFATEDWVKGELPLDASVTQKGIVQLSASVGTSTTKVPHEKAVSDALSKKADTSKLGTAAGKNTGNLVGQISENKFNLLNTNSNFNNRTLGTSGGVNILSPIFDGTYDYVLSPLIGDTAVPSYTQNGTGYCYATAFSLFNNNRTLLFIPYATSGNSGSLCWRGSFNDNATPIVFSRDSRNTSVDVNGFIKQASPIVVVFHDGHYETNDESEGAEVRRTGTGQYHITGILGYNSDGAWGVNGGVSVPKDNNGLELVYVDDRVQEDGSLIIETCHRQHVHLPERFQNWRLKEVTPEGERIFYQDGEPCDLPESTRLDVRVEMPQGSVWNVKQRELDEQMKTNYPER